MDGDLQRLVHIPIPTTLGPYKLRDPGAFVLGMGMIALCIQAQAGRCNPLTITGVALHASRPRLEIRSRSPMNVTRR